MSNLAGDPEIISISTLNDFSFCPRRFALHQVEGLWEDNEHTILGTLLHEQADESGYETEAGVKILRALPLFSRKFWLSGKADVVELRDGKPYPVEYKKGRKRRFENDDVQLCAQALCLEEMFNAEISEGAIFHSSSKKRRVVVLSPSLREQTISIISSARSLLDFHQIPPAEYSPRCEECSLFCHCLPSLTSANFRKTRDSYSQDLWKGDEKMGRE